MSPLDLDKLLGTAGMEFLGPIVELDGKNALDDLGCFCYIRHPTPEKKTLDTYFFGGVLFGYPSPKNEIIVLFHQKVARFPKLTAFTVPFWLNTFCRYFPTGIIQRGWWWFGGHPRSYVKGDLVALGCERLRVLERGECHVVRSGRTLRTLKAGKGDVLEPLKMCILEGGERKQLAGRRKQVLFLV